MKHRFLLLPVIVLLAVVGCSRDEERDEMSDPGSVEIPDPVFRAYCLRNFDRDGDGVLSDAEARSIRTVDCRGMEVASLVGIERFPNLDSLVCMDCPSLEELDISANRALRVLICHNCDLWTLDLTFNPALKILGCSGNSRLGTLNVGSNPNLTLLACSGLNIETLNVSRNPRLDTLICGNNRLFSLNVTRNHELIWLDVSQGWAWWRTEKLDVSYCPKLQRLECENVDSLILKRGQVIPELAVAGVRIYYRD